MSAYNVNKSIQWLRCSTSNMIIQKLFPLGFLDMKDQAYANKLVRHVLNLNMGSNTSSEQSYILYILYHTLCNCHNTMYCRVEYNVSH